MTRDELIAEQMTKLKESVESADNVYMTEVAMPGCAPTKINKEEIDK